jgi:endonuclease YncB( thermonuclease family)
LKTCKLISLALVLASCGTSTAARKQRAPLSAELVTRLEAVGLSLGEFPIEGEAGVVDGDTIRVRGLDSSLRLLGLDAEETFKKEADRRAAGDDFAAYLKSQRGGSPRPVKSATPLGEAAKAWAKKFFDGVKTVRLERDHAGEIRDYYGRYLAYALVERDGKWINFNVECVRAGMSPYFTKYGRSRRFHDELAKAQVEAQEARRGIWDPALQHYDDYAERLAWWGAREAELTRFEEEASADPTRVSLNRFDAFLKLEQRLGQEATVLGAVSEIHRGDRGPTVVKLARTRGSDFSLVFFDKDVFLASGLAAREGELVEVRGVVSQYVDRRRQQARLQMVVTLPGQISPSTSPSLSERDR